MPSAIGIDLGTSFSAVGVLPASGQPVVFSNEHGNVLTPSVVHIDNAQNLWVGEQARQLRATYPLQTIYHIRRIIGRNPDDCTLNQRFWPFELVRDCRSGKAVVRVHGMHYTPETVTAAILDKMKSIAASNVDAPNDAVITVPANFNDAQRQATKEAGAMAGLNVLQLLDEPAALALTYFNITGETEKKYLVYDLGRHSFNVAIVKTDGAKAEVRCSDGLAFGGHDLDRRICQEINRSLQQSGSNLVLPESQWLHACEEAKKQLSIKTSVRISFGTPQDGEVYYDLTRCTFLNICSDLFKSTLNVVANVLLEAGLVTNDIDEVVIAGGCSRIPRVRELMQFMFHGRNVASFTHPELALVQGAAIRAAHLVNKPAKTVQAQSPQNSMPKTDAAHLLNMPVQKLQAQSPEVPMLATDQKPVETAPDQSMKKESSLKPQAQLVEKPAQIVQDTSRKVSSPETEPAAKEPESSFKFATEFKIVKTLGLGDYGVVFNAIKIENKLNYAVKRIALSASDEIINNVIKEINEMSQLKHVGIVCFYRTWIEKTQRESQVRGTASIYIQMQLCDSSLAKWLKDAGNAPRDIIRMKSWFKQIVQAVAYIHENSQIHMNLKPSNILFVGSDQLKISDLAIVPPSHEEEQASANASSLYGAPEQGSTLWNSKVDIFSLGLILAELCIIMTEKKREEIFKQIRGGIKLDIEKDQYQSEETANFITWLTIVESEKRPTCDELLRDKYLADPDAEADIWTSTTEIVETKTRIETVSTSRKVQVVNSSVSTTKILTEAVTKEHFSSEFQKMDLSNGVVKAEAQT